MQQRDRSYYLNLPSIGIKSDSKMNEIAIKPYVEFDLASFGLSVCRCTTYPVITFNREEAFFHVINLLILSMIKLSNFPDCLLSLLYVMKQMKYFKLKNRKVPHSNLSEKFGYSEKGTFCLRNELSYRVRARNCFDQREFLLV